MLKRFFGAFLALALYVGLAQAQFLTLMDAGSANSLLPNQLIFQSSQSCVTASNACTVSSAAFGSPQANRYIVFTLSGTSGCTSTTTVTIGGVTATKIREATLAGTSGIYGAAVPTGTTGNIVWTCNIAPSNPVYISWYTIYGLNSLTADSSNQSSNGANCTMATTVNNGYAISAIGYQSTTGSSTISGTGTVQDFDADYGSAHASGGHAPTTGSSLSIGYSRSATATQLCVALH